MNRAAALRALLLATSTIVPFTTFAQPAPSPSAQSGTADAIRVLLDQASYWRAQSQDDKANQAVSRVLVLDPNNADALAMQAQAAADAGDTAVASAALAKLKAVRADDPRIATVAEALKAGPVDAAALAEARAFSKAGKPDAAVAAYRRAFKGDTPTAALAVEYYQALINTKEDWNIPRAGLAAVLRANPENLNAQLVYAELLTYHEEARAEGVQRLIKLSQNPAIAAQATKDLRQSLFWLDVSPESVPQYDIYLAKHPDDKEVAKLAAVARSNNDDLRATAFQDLENGKIEDADTAFTDALKRVPNDVNAMIGLALTRWQERRVAEGKELLKKAIALDPSKAAEYQTFVDTPDAVAMMPAGTGFGGGTYQFRQAGNYGGGRNYRGGGTYRNGRYYGNGDYGRAIGRRIQAEWAQVAKLTNAGEFDQAAALLRRLGGPHPNAGTLAYLADIQARAGHLAEAEAGYRAVLAHSPRNVAALGGLAGVLAREGKQSEADALFAQAAQLPGGASVGASRANALFEQAKQMTDPVAQIGMFRSAVNADPANPWIRSELARALRGQNDEAGARAVMAPVIDAAHPTNDQLLAAIYFANDAQYNSTVIRLIGELPAKQQTVAMLAIRDAAEVRQDIKDAKALGSEAAERDRLLSLASKPDPRGVMASAYGYELIKQGDKSAARELIRRAMATGTPTAAQRVAYAGTLLAAGYQNDAKAITQSVTPTSGLMTQQLAEVRNGAAVATSDKLNAAGRPDAAYDELAPRLAAAPDNPDLNLALARLYSSNQQPAKAVKITQGLLEQNPSNLAVRSSAVYANMAEGELREANTIARETTEQFPDEPQAWFDLANVERARGHTGNALRALQTAKSLREKQLSGQQSAADEKGNAPKTVSVAPLRRRYAQYALYIPPNTANDASPGPLPEPVSRQYAQYDANPAQLPIEPQPAAPANSPLVSTGYAPFQAVAPTRATAGPAGSAFMAAPSGEPPASTPAMTPPPMQLAQVSAFLSGSDQGNPFARGSSPLPNLDEPIAPTGTTSFTTGAVSNDPMTAQIDQSLQQVKEELAPRLDTSVELRGRTGTTGFERLISVSAPIEASFSPNDYGRLAVTVTPTYLYSGNGTNSFSVSQFGTNPLGGTNGLAAARVRNQAAVGSALDVRYAYDIATADIGATPLGFQVENVVGGIELAPKIAPNLTLRVLAERRAVTDSILSFGGMKDYRTGETFGGVTRNHGHVQLEGQIGLANYFVGAGGGYLVGHNVASNSEIDATIGGSYPVWRTPTQEVRVGSQLIYFGYDKNLAGFSLGQGGYFSPQDYFAILFPVNYRNQITPDLRFGVGGTVGFQTFRSANSSVFPNNSALQSQLVSLAATTGQTTVLGGGHGAGIAGGVNGDIDYRVNANLHIGARAGFDHSGTYSEGVGLIYARYVFNDPL
jgi:predicted Zn-dependent protease